MPNICRLILNLAVTFSGEIVDSMKLVKVTVSAPGLPPIVLGIHINIVLK